MSDCIFCKISGREIPSERIFENDNFFSIFDIAPQINGHVLIISKKHFVNMTDFPSETAPDLIDAFKKTYNILKEKFNADGFHIIQNNFKSAGQIVDHAHFHILPRKTGDRYIISIKKRK